MASDNDKTSEQGHFTEPQLSSAAENKIQELKKLYPDPKSAVMPALYIAQEELGYINDQAIKWVSARIGLAPVHVEEVATFYTMYYKKPIGRYHIQVCRTLSCALRGMKDLTKCLKEDLNLSPGQISADGFFSYEEVECLGSCGTGPMCQINDRFFENLDTEKLRSIITKIRSQKPNLSLSTVKDDLGEGLPEEGFSQLKG